MNAVLMCVVCDKVRASQMTGALCDECEDVTKTFTPKMWERVEAMTPERANAFLLKRKAQPRIRAAIAQAGAAEA